MLLPPIEERLKQMIRGVCEEHQAEIEALEVMPDHVQRYSERRSPIWHSSPDEVGQGPFLSSLASGVSDVEAEAANMWTNSYVCATIGGAPLSLLKQYLEQQKHV